MYRPCVVLVCAATVGIVAHTAYDFQTTDAGTHRWGGVSHCQEIEEYYGNAAEYTYVAFVTINAGFQMLVSLLLASCMLWKISGKKDWSVMWFMFLAWARSSVSFLFGARQLSDQRQYEDALMTAGVPLDVLLLAQLYVVAFNNTALLEQAMIQRLGSAILWRMGLLIAPIAAAAGWVSFSHGRVRDNEPILYAVFGCLAWSIVLILAAAAVIATRSAVVLWHGARVACHDATFREKREARQARRIARVLSVLTGTSLFASLPNLYVYHIIQASVWPMNVESTRSAACVCFTKVPIDVIATFTTFGLMVFTSGIFSITPRLKRDADAQESDRIRKRRSVILNGKATSSGAWAESVDDLVSRGFTLEALLKFYRGLGHEYMIHYDPEKSTTNDVVRGAIIPLSSDAKCALAVLMMDRVPTKPKALVTHAWKSNFCDLVSAIVADALGEGSFEFASRMLNGKPELLESLLARRGVLHYTYWVSAFSVNQHASICGTPQGEDAVTNEAYSPCICSLPKLWNDSPPLDDDGRSIRCEMNKFAYMMHYLATADTEFYQVIVMDRETATLKRCWCVAEIVEAHKCGVLQSIKVFSPLTFREHKKYVKILRVEESEASRPEDVVEILSKIPDKDEFNNQCRCILESAIANWSDLPLKELITRAGRVRLHHMHCC